jgi:hypothetical protein
MLIPSFGCHRVEGYFLKRFTEVTMKKTSHFNLKFLLFLFILPILISGCGNQEINSQWSKGDIKIDGNQENWGNTLNYLKDDKIGIGVKNDSDNVYICLVTSDRGHIMHALRNGFTIWIDPQNDNRTYGIKFPIGMSNDMMFNYQENQNQNGSYQDMGSMMKKYESSMNEFELVNQNGELLSGIPIKNDYGIELKINLTRDQLVYELKIPLNHSVNKGFFVNTAPGSLIRLGFEEGKIDRSQMQKSSNENGYGEGSGEGEGGEGRRGSGMRERGMGRGSNSGERPVQNSDQLNTWLKVALAKDSVSVK